ncbi:MAG: LLM class flavin-dependent oxidoreductase [Candidatus Heimdallarchaeota archaeon]|nr:LLM class flavin-dependent oxidoreductase [Candidatus Heimdallarchaeota archaeon]MCK4769689.1 LLM class flavin-dependent oxidoreductase [Candidatus Heimdallarchaeota archaeon]
MTTYGVQIEPQFGFTFDEIKGIVQYAEEIGMTHTWFSDHFMLKADSIEQNSFECISAMMAAASYTQKLRIGPLVLSNSYRYPAVLAKQIACLDQYSKGRIEFGYGAGWKEMEYNAYGIEFPSAGTRIKQLEEALQIIKSLWTENITNFDGDYYKIKDAVAAPKPYQKPYPTIWIGLGSGKPKMTKLAAKYAEGINYVWAIPPEELKEKFDEFDGIVKEIGRDPASIKKSYGALTDIYADEEAKKEAKKKAAEERKVPIEEVEKGMKRALVGTKEEIIEKMKEYKKLKLDHFIIMFPYQKELEQMKIFKEEIFQKI